MTWGTARDKMTSAVTFMLWTVWSLCLEGVLAGKCYKDEAIGDRDGNVYHCNSDALPRCCQDEGQATCCVDETEKNIEDQLQLWGTVGAMLLLIGILFVCIKTDVSFCNNDKSLAERWKTFRSKKAEPLKEDESESTRGTFYDNPMGGFTKGEGRDHDPYQKGLNPQHTPPSVVGRHDYHKFDSIFA